MIRHVDQGRRPTSAAFDNEKLFKIVRRKHMNCIKTTLIMVITVLFIGLSALSATAEEGDFIEEIYSCGPDVFIKMKNAGMVAILESEVGISERDFLLSIASDIKASGLSTGYFDPGDPLDICGVNGVRPITVIEK